MAVLHSPYMQVENASGLLSGALLYFYSAGTTTEITVYQESTTVTPHTNPVVADSTGLFAPIWVAASSYKTVLKTSAGVTVQTVDNIPGATSNTGVFADDVFTLQDNLDSTKQLQFQLSGLTAAQTVTWTVPASSGTLMLTPGDPGADRIVFWDDSATQHQNLSVTPNLVISGTELRLYETWVVALSDETTAITTGTNKATIVFPYAFTLVGVAGSLSTASSSGTPTFDINEGGSTILSTKIVIDVNEKSGGSSGYQGTAAAAAVISDTALAAFAEIGFDIDVAGTGAKGAKAYLIGYRSA